MMRIFCPMKPRGVDYLAAVNAIFAYPPCCRGRTQIEARHEMHLSQKGGGVHETRDASFW